MHGPAPASPPHRPPATGVVVLLRVIFVATAVCSLGLLAWVAMLRAAIVQRRPLGWWLFGADLIAMIGSCVLIVSFPETDWRTNAGVGLLLLQIAGAVAYYLVVDIRAAGRSGYAQGQEPGYAQGYGPAHPPAGPPVGPAPHPYGPPQPPAPAPLHAQETRPYANEAHPYARNPYGAPAPHTPPVSHTPPAPPPQDRPRPQRIHQVRAELDELSDYLRQEGRQ
ncbi:hypothetical protein [Streptomyces sp. NPDC048650]|uniref:hypothetical protein n=1 Tax=unclassified Streptomyces TaxID=2593676 RepID=UPI00371823C2